LIQTFNKGLTPQARSVLDSIAGGSIMSKTIEEAFDLIQHLPPITSLGPVKGLCTHLAHECISYLPATILLLR
jgi:hypothetical protein